MTNQLDTALTPYQEQRIATRDAMTHGDPMAIVPRNFAEALAMAEVMSKSELVPFKLRQRKEDILMIMMSGAEFQFPPLRSLSLFHVIEGVPKLTADGVAGLVMSRTNVCEKLEPIEQSATRVTWKGKRRGGTELTLTWTIEEAKAAGLCPGKPDKNGGPGNWIKYPRQMLNARCKADLCRLLWPDVCAGLVTAEEAYDTGPSDPMSTMIAPPSTTDARKQITSEAKERAASVTVAVEPKTTARANKSKPIDVASTETKIDPEASARAAAFEKARENTRQTEDARRVPTSDSPVAPERTSPTEMDSGSADPLPERSQTSSDETPPESSKASTDVESSQGSESSAVDESGDGFGGDDVASTPPPQTIESFRAELAAATAQTIDSVKAAWIPWSKDDSETGGKKHAMEMRNLFAKRAAELKTK